MSRSDARLHGKAWEDVFKLRAQSNGLLAIKNQLTAHYIGGGGVKVTKSELDFKLIRRTDGRVGYFDCKTFDNKHFDYSEINPDQLERSVLYNDCRVPSGFIVHLRPIDIVLYYPGRMIKSAGPGTRFGPTPDRILGALLTFDLRPLLDSA